MIESKREVGNLNEWRTLKGFSWFLFSADGQVYDIVKETIKPQFDNGGGYMQVNLLNDDGVRKRVYVHRAVYQAFKGDIPKGMMIELYASMAQAEIEKKEKRQREGIQAKKARGEWEDYGRPRVMSLDEFTTHYRLVQQGKKKPFELMRELGMTKPTFYRYKNQIEKG